MSRGLTFALLLAGVAAVVAAAPVLGEVDFDPSTFNPLAGEAVTFIVCEPCLGMSGQSYRWDWDGDGRYD